jgi:hypothetical protein
MGNRAAGYLHAAAAAWRTGTRRSQRQVALVLLTIVAASFVVSVTVPEWMPLAAYFLYLLVAMMLLGFRPLVLVAGVNAAAAVVAWVTAGPMTLSRAIAVAAFVAATLLVLVVASRQRTGLPALLGGEFLSDLRDRLQSQGGIPPLPDGWHSQSAMIPSQGGTYAGDFLVADLSEDRKVLEVILVDVCGKGTGAGPAALQFAGALGGLIGALPPSDLFRAANDFLFRQGDDEAFATAVHLLVDLEGGAYQITSAGHPPALRWDLDSREWVVDNARGTALGVLSTPELRVSEGCLRPGEALLFYTDGVVESRGSHIDAGIAWLQRAAGEAIGDGFAGAARRIIRQVDSGDDDRALLILDRVAVGSREVDDASQH